jgi:hypothetical protein
MKFIITLVLCLFVSASQARAVPVLDQIYLDPRFGGVGTALPEASHPDGLFRRAQTFTVGLSGLLNSVDIIAGIGEFPGAPGASMQILATANGVPTFTVLASVDFFERSTDGWFVWDLSSANLTVTPGQVLAMEMIGGGFLGFTPGAYTGGADYFLNIIQGFPNFTLNPNTDIFFRTFVGTGPREDLIRIPEPSAIWLLLFGCFAVYWVHFRFPTV